MARSLAETLQALYDSEIHVTITWVWDNGIDFALVPYMDWESTKEKWHNVRRVAELADTLHERALVEYPESAYVRMHPSRNGQQKDAEEQARRFPFIPHQAAFVECPGQIIPEPTSQRDTTLKCNDCGAAVGKLNTAILNNLVNLAGATDLDRFVPDPDHINALPEPLRKYIHDLATRADPAGDVAEIALLKENNRALWARIRELEER